MAQFAIDIVGADANNLKHLNVRFPLNKISVVTGVSGSGKSSLLADTLAAEGSRRTRTFLGLSQREIEREDVRAFVGRLPPTILIGQRGFRPTIRTTVATATGFLAVLRRLFVLHATPRSDAANEAVPPPSADSYGRWIERHYRGRAEIWVAPVRQLRTDGYAAVDRLRVAGIKRAMVYSESDSSQKRERGRPIDTTAFRGLNPAVLHTIEAQIGTVTVGKPGHTNALRGMLTKAFALGRGSVVVMLSEADILDLRGPFGTRLDSSKHWVHPEDEAVFAPASEHLLSFNAPGHEDSGACPSCHGTGVGRQLNETALIPHPERSMRDGAFAIWTPKNYRYVNVQHETIEGLLGLQGFDPEVPWSRLPESAKRLVLDGSGKQLIVDQDRSGRKVGTGRPFLGFKNIILSKAAAGTRVAAHLAPFVDTGKCELCGGTRWSLQARALRIGGYGIADLLGLNFTDVGETTGNGRELSEAVPASGRRLVVALNRHARSLMSVGLSHLSGDRGMLEVSEGESRRIRLARSLDPEEEGFCFLFDEPARGLHEADLTQLGGALSRLRNRHTVVLNEHRERLWDVADWFVEVGPGAGDSGGEISYVGERVKRAPSPTEKGSSARTPSKTNSALKVRGATIHNIRDLDCDIPLGAMTCISGVSGSGKSSFVRGVLTPALLEAVGGQVPSDFPLQAGAWKTVVGVESITEVVALGQALPPPNRRSLVATVTGLFDVIRKLFGASAEARRNHLSPSDFGLNAGKGRCSTCLGLGEIAEDDLWTTCPACGGARYGQSALSIRANGVNVLELLDTPFDRLSTLAEQFQMPLSLVDAVCDLGIGYLSLGRRLDTLSGGEVQRLRLAMRLAKDSPGSLFFILDEPAAGLHPLDVPRLRAALDRALDGGRHTLVVIEHNVEILKAAHRVLEFGPGSGPAGGQIVFDGSPTELAKAKTPTGLALAGKLPPVSRTSSESQPRESRNGAQPEVNERVERSTALLRTLISGDGAAYPGGDSAPAKPVVSITDRFWLNRDAWELVGLDREMPKLLLDVWRHSQAESLSDLLSAWEDDTSSWLAIHPFLTAMQSWRADVPKSSIREVVSHLVHEGLRLVTTTGEPVETDFDVREVRAVGARFEADDRRSRQRAVDDALAIGAGYVELHDGSGKLRAAIATRLLDVDTATVAPMSAVPSQFSRHERRGQCRMCRGNRVVPAIPSELVIGREDASPDSPEFLTCAANAVMKGVYQNHLRPFLKRLATEGLWDSTATFDQLNSSQRDVVLFGYWSRPGHGSFLKNSKANPAEVSSWLRWDGLNRHVLEQVDRSRDAAWREAVRRGVRPARCLICDGTGLEPYAGLLRLDDSTFTEWVLETNATVKLEQLRKLAVQTARQQQTKDRILDCLESLADSNAAPSSIVKRAVETFTTMPAVTPVPVDGE